MLVVVSLVILTVLVGIGCFAWGWSLSHSAHTGFVRGYSDEMVNDLLTDPRNYDRLDVTEALGEMTIGVNELTFANMVRRLTGRD